jgi:hypothetical protein
MPGETRIRRMKVKLVKIQEWPAVIEEGRRLRANPQK